MNMFHPAARLGLTALVLSASACSEDDEGAAAVTPEAPFTLRPGVQLVTVFGSAPGTALTLRDEGGEALITLISDDLGQANFAYLASEHLTLESADITRIPLDEGNSIRPGDGYTISADELDPPYTSPAFRILAVGDAAEASFYESQTLTGATTSLLGETAPEALEEGFQYITMRDGVELSVMVRFPDPLLYGEGPWPTVVEYSGYSPSRPDGGDPGTTIATLLGYATVGVNMRGTGCSGGVFDVFNPAQHADGYDIVEVVAAQDWVLHGHVGMVGLSYPGISQLFVAATNPPSLAGVAPFSVIADPWEIQWPGGIYNSGFTRSWVGARDSAASAGGMNWVSRRVDGGDETCAEHQNLRRQNIDFEAFLSGLRFRPADADERSLPLLVEQIEAPVLLAGGFQDEQTGGEFGAMLDRFDSARFKRFAIYNGRHPDGYSPLLLTRWFEFLELFVARRVPRLNQLVRDVGAEELSRQYGAEGLGFEPDRFADFADDDYDGVLEAYLAESEVRVLVESGAGREDAPGAPVARGEVTFDSWPPPEATETTLYFGSGGALGNVAPTDESASDSYRHDPEAGAIGVLEDDRYPMLQPLWPIEWTRFADGDQLAYDTPALESDLVLAGASYVRLWIRGEVDEAHVQATLSELRSDGQEVYIQSGWLAAGHRAYQEITGDRRVVRDFAKERFEPLPAGEWTELVISIPTVFHGLRAGSRLRVAISSPGRNHPLWKFTPPDYDGGPPTFDVARDAIHPSALVFSTVANVTLPEGYPPCPSLRGQPCRELR